MKNKSFDCYRDRPRETGNTSASASGPAALRVISMSPDGKKVKSQAKTLDTKNGVTLVTGSSNVSLSKLDVKSKDSKESTQPEMISRRDILLRARQAEDEKEDQRKVSNEDDEDIWHDKEKLYKDHIEEVLTKWEQIDDEIWAKVICMEKNRRVAKAYVRLPFLIVDGSEIGFDGIRVGLKGFENMDRGDKTKETLESLGEGVKIKMDDKGNILIKRVGRCSAYVKTFAANKSEVKSSTCVGKDILEAKGKLEYKKVMNLFDIRTFQNNIASELKETYPQRRKLEAQCISAISFGKDCSDLMESPSWIMIINIVALELLNSELPLGLENRLASNRNKQQPKQQQQQQGNNKITCITASQTNGLIANGRALVTCDGVKSSRPGSKDHRKRDFKSDDRVIRSSPIKDKNRLIKSIEVRLPDPDYDFELPPIRESRLLRKEDPYYCGLSAKVTHQNGSRVEKREYNQNGYTRLQKPLNGHKIRSKYPLINRFYSYSSSDSSPSSCETSYSTIYNISDGSTRIDMKTGRY